MHSQQTLETWEMRAKRLAIKRRRIMEIPQDKRTKKERSELSQLTYALKRHIDEVTDGQA